MEKNYLSVAQVNTYIKQIFDSELMLKNICIYGEISSYNISNGIAYFNIKDSNGQKYGNVILDSLHIARVRPINMYK